jgi:hypothetical protein
MTTKKITVWILASLRTLAISPCNSGINREKLSEVLLKYDDFTISKDMEGFIWVKKTGNPDLLTKQGKK